MAFVVFITPSWIVSRVGVGEKLAGQAVDAVFFDDVGHVDAAPDRMSDCQKR